MTNILSSLHIIFLLRQKMRKKGLNLTVYCRVTTHGPRSEFSTGITLTESELGELWNYDTGKFVNTNELGVIYNKKLNAIEAELEAIHLNLYLQKIPIGPSTVINLFKGVETLHTTFLTVCSEYLESRELEYEKGDLSTGTFIKDELYVKNLEEFLRSTKRMALLPQEFRIKIAKEFSAWLNSSRNNTARHLEFYRRALDNAVNNDYLTFNPLAAMKMRRDRTKKIEHLDQIEIEAMLKARFEVEVLQQCAHLFLFQCGNGFSYGDIYNKFEVISRPEGKFFSGARIKNDEVFFVPLFPLSQTILEIYDGKLPYIDNRLYNRCLKQIAPMLGIKKHLTTHTARKTFASIKYSEGWSIDAIADMLGHSSTKTTETHYIKRSETRVINEMIRMTGNA